MSHINGVPDAYRGPTRAPQAIGKGRSGLIPRPSTEKGKPAAIPADTVGVSEISRKMRIAMKEAASLPTENAWVRKVASLGRAVKEGSYMINADKVAAKLVLSSLTYATDSPLIH